MIMQKFVTRRGDPIGKLITCEGDSCDNSSSSTGGGVGALLTQGGSTSGPSAVNDQAMGALLDRSFGSGGVDAHIALIRAK